MYIGEGNWTGSEITTRDGRTALFLPKSINVGFQQVSNTQFACVFQSQPETIKLRLISSIRKLQSWQMDLLADRPSPHASAEVAWSVRCAM